MLNEISLSVLFYEARIKLITHEEAKLKRRREAAIKRCYSNIYKPKHPKKPLKIIQIQNGLGTKAQLSLVPN